jgi:hypothetical protein
LSPPPMLLYSIKSPIPAILHPHSAYFLSIAPSIQLKNHAQHDGPAKFWCGYPRQIPLAALPFHPDRLGFEASSSLPQYPHF